MQNAAETKRVKKTDRRTIYTKNVIKRSLLELMDEKPFDKISITDVCRRADINRGTYYLHYYELGEVLDELLDDALSGAGGRFERLQISDTCARSECPNSLCRMVRHSEEYAVLFRDEALTGRIIAKLASIYLEDFSCELMKTGRVTRRQAEAVFYFQMNGCLAISRSGRGIECSEWMEMRRAIDGFIAGGIEKIASGT